MTWTTADHASPASEEWPTALDVQQRAVAGWRPTPFRQFILKFRSRCNLSCSYCYVYNLADSSYLRKPRKMTGALVPKIAMRIAEHVYSHSIPDVRVIFHGGEPLLGGAGPILDALQIIRSAVGAGVGVSGWVQTNGTLLQEGFLDQFEQAGIRVCVSLDGDAASHDRNRRYANGQGSYQVVAHGLELLMSRPRVYSGLICVADLQNDPVATYEALLRFGPPAIDFHLPHGNWSSPPPGRNSDEATPYADWLIEIFDRWYDSERRETGIRLFEEIISLLFGRPSGTEAVGLTPSSLIIIEADGSIEQSDILKSAYDGAAETGLHVERNSFNDALRLPHVMAMQMGLAALSEECMKCPARMVCGAGLYAHRYQAGRGFLNRSVYCKDLYALIAHIRGRVADDLRSLQRRS